MTEQAELRRRMRHLRRSLSPAEQDRHAQGLARVLGRSRVFHRARRIAAYLAADGELDPGPLILRAAGQGKRVHFPVLHRQRAGSLWFVEHRPGDPLLPNRFGIPEPLVSHRKPTPLWSLDLILLPLVAFDRHGNRLGMGGGYYDRTLAGLHSGGHWRRPWLVGIAHGFQRVEQLPASPWDVPLDAVATESSLMTWRTR